jgi:thioredoxin 1
MIKAFTATWCGPCKMIKPILHKLNDEGKVEIEFYDIDEFPDLAKDFGVKAVPTLIYFNDGEEINRTTGFQPEHMILEKHGAI